MAGKLFRRRARPRFRRRTPPGASPGTLAPQPDALPSRIHVIAYDEQRLVEETVRQATRVENFLGRYAVTWVNVDGLGDRKTLQQLAAIFKLHPLALEDVVHVHQRAKVEPYHEQLFVVARMVGDQRPTETEQLSLFLGPQYVLTFQEHPGDCMDPIRERLRKTTGPMRRVGSDYLAYAILDTVIDSYFPVVDQYADRLDELEDLISSNRQEGIFEQLHQVRHDLLLLRRAVRPHREAVNQLIRDESPLIQSETRIFLRDTYDHTIQLIDLLEVYREMCADLRDFYLSLVNHRMNEVMKVLTIIATIFIPLSFIASLYGMNFNTALPGNMPELNWPYGYWFALGIMLAVASGMMAFFRRRRWIGSLRTRSGKAGR